MNKPLPAACSWQSLFSWARGVLEQVGVPSAQVDIAELAEYCGWKRTEGITHELLAQDIAQKFISCVREREQRVPLQHITGTMYFRFLTLHSEPGCFIVRPETEMVAQAAINELRQLAYPALVADLCAGSGAIGLSLATEIPGTRVYAVEKSPEAFTVLEKNNAAYGNCLTPVLADAREALSELAGQLTMVVSNPPYVPPLSGVDDELSPEVCADPPMALWGGGDDGCDFPRSIIDRAKILLGPGGVLIMEHDPRQSTQLREYACACGFGDVSTGKDLTGRERFLLARLS